MLTLFNKYSLKKNWRSKSDYSDTLKKEQNFPKWKKKLSEYTKILLERTKIIIQTQKCYFQTLKHKKRTSNEILFTNQKSIRSTLDQLKTTNWQYYYIILLKNCKYQNRKKKEKSSNTSSWFIKTLKNIFMF